MVPSGRRSRGRRKSPPLITAFLTVWCLITAVPLFYVLLNAFKNYDDIMYHPLEINPARWSLTNFLNAWNVMKLGEGFVANTIFLALSLVIMVLAGSLMGFAVNIVHSRFLRFAFRTVILVITIPFQAIMIPVVVLMGNLHLLNSYMGTSLLFAATAMPIVVFLYAGAMKTIPRELCEATVVDGGGMMQTYALVYFPLLKVITGTVLIIRGTPVWNDLLINMITVTDPVKKTVIYRLTTFLSTRMSNWDFVFGGVVLISLPIIILFFLLQNVFITGITAGAVKG
jgi:raffinose/stachyose/melibiose transport system permease protein